MSEAVLLVGTKMGLSIYALGIDTHGDIPRMFVSGTGEHRGPGIYRSDDQGHTWTEGAAVRLPAELGDRADQAGLDAGARDGTAFTSLDDGDSWTQIAAHLPDVLTVRAAVLA